MTSAWRVRVTLGGGLYLMGRGGGCAPLYVHTFGAFAMGIGRRYEDLHTVPERLRWCRYRLGLMQKEVAQRVGISQTLYEEMERGDCREYQAYAVDKLAGVGEKAVRDCEMVRKKVSKRSWERIKAILIL